MNEIASPSIATSRVVWTVRARRKLDQLLGIRLAESENREFIMSNLDIHTRLSRLFSGNNVTIIVQDLCVGFRPRVDCNILLVEVDDPENPGPWVVKIGPAEDLEREWVAWTKCRPHGLRHDLVLMTLDPRYDQGTLIALVYGDAKQSIGVDSTCTLEEAVANATLYGTPTVLSVRFALIQLFERLGQLLHAVAWDDERNVSRDGPNLEFPQLWSSLQLWGAKFRRVDQAYVRPDLTPRKLAVDLRRRPGNSDRPELGFLDPVDYLAKFVKPFTSWRVLRREVETLEDTTDRSILDIGPDANATVQGGTRPPPNQFIPRFRRGRVHGDLHGRNVHVGIANGQAHWPSVFDFEDMHEGGLIGLDFVKLETELKIRILPRIFDQSLLEDDSLQFQQFEYSLNEWSEFNMSSERWPRLEALADPRPPGAWAASTVTASSKREAETADRLSRLRTILLEIRRLASVALGTRAGRPADWMREYLFLQMCYGSTEVRFENLTERELTSAFIAAGCAAGWLANRREGVGMTSDGTNIAADAEAEARNVTDAVYPGFQVPLRIAHGWAIKSRERIPAAILVLEDLRAEYPHALKVRAELVLVYLDAGARKQAERELELLERTFPFDQDEEALCRFGRLHREIGDDWVKGSNPTDEQFRMATREYEIAWNYYDRAFKIRRGHYPGINRASLYFLRGWAARTPDVRETFVVQSRDAAKDLLERRETWPHHNSDDDIWHLASAAEARLLLSDWAQSHEDYRSARSHKLAREFHRDCVGKEVRRLLRPLSEVGNLPEGTVATLLALFPPPDNLAMKA